MNWYQLILFILALLGSFFSPQRGLDSLASVKMQYIQAGNWSHDMPGCNYGCQSNKFYKNHQWMGENLAKGPATQGWCSKAFIYKKWNESPTHKAVLDKKGVKYESFRVEQKGSTCYAVLERAI